MLTCKCDLLYKIFKCNWTVAMYAQQTIQSYSVNVSTVHK